MLLRQFDVLTINGKTLAQACKKVQIVVGQWVKHYNQTRSHSSLGCRPPTPQARVPRVMQNQLSLMQ